MSKIVPEYIILDIAFQNNIVNQLEQYIKQYLPYRGIAKIANVVDFIEHLDKDHKFFDFNELYFDDFVSNFRILLVISDKPKREFNNFKKNLLLSMKTVYPIQIIRIRTNEDENKFKSKLNKKVIFNYEKLETLFKKAYHGLAMEMFDRKKHNDYFEFIRENIKVCPYCRQSDFVVINDLEELKKQRPEEDFLLFGWFCKRLICNNCKEEIVFEPLAHFYRYYWSQINQDCIMPFEG